MGLIGNLTADSKDNSYRENIKSAYFKIEAVNIDTNSEKVRVQVRGWMSEYARHNQGIGIFKRVFYIPIDEFSNVKCTKDTLMKKAYKYISTLPEFEKTKNALKTYSGAIDITAEKVEEQEKELEDLIKELKE